MLVFPLEFPVEPSEAVREAAQASVRRSDPQTSHKAAQAVAPGLCDLEKAILRVVPQTGGMTAFTIAKWVNVGQPDRWDEGSIRTRVSALGKAGLLVKAAQTQTSPRGREADAWLLP